MYAARLAVAVLVLAAVAACATPPPPPAIADLTSRQCANEVDLANAKAVILDKEVEAKFDASAPCWQRANEKSVYAVFVFPDSADPLTISVRSDPWANYLVAPRLRVLDGLGQVSREIA